jgi:hypothetical protein
MNIDKSDGEICGDVIQDRLQLLLPSRRGLENP